MTLYLIREDGKLRIEHDMHILGLFTLDTWRTTLRDAGFEVHEESNPGAPSEDARENTPTFVCVKPT